MSTSSSNPSGLYANKMRRIKRQTSRLAKEMLELMKSFYSLSRNSSTPEVLDSITKELITLAIAVATYCDDCIAFHVQTAMKEGATQEEITEALGVCIFIGGGPALMYAAHVMEAMEEFEAAQ